jgi:predicted extracellular nuclease
MKLTIGTFNTENLFLRYYFNKKERGNMFAKPTKWKDLLAPVVEAKTEEAMQKKGAELALNINMLGWELENTGPVSKSARVATAKVILENLPDVLAVQEVENLEALLQFNRHFLKNAYPYAMVIDGNDMRQIDVGVLSKYDLVSIRSHRFEPKGAGPTGRTFSRDCLEVTIRPTKTKELTILVNHFKSQIAKNEEERLKGVARRKAQATRVVEILQERFGKKLVGNFVVAGDLNAGPETEEMQPLLEAGLVNVLDRLPEEERWTHYYKKNKAAEQLDYLLLSPALAKANKGKPWIERRGLGTDINYYKGERFEQVEGKEGASDHCAIFIEVTI